MLNLIGEGVAKGAKKAIKETAEEAGEKAISKVAKKTMSSLADDVLDTGPSVLNSLVRQSKGPSLVDIAKARTKVMPEYTTIYHNTPLDNVDSIVKNGIKADAGARKYPDRSEVGIWGSSVKGDGYGGSTIAFRMPADEAKKYMVNDTEYLIPRDIAPEDIVDVDRMLVSSGGATLRQSQIPEKIAKYGEDKVVEVMKRFGADDNTIKAMLGKNAQQDRLKTPYLMSKGPSLVDMARNIKAMRASRNMAEDGIRRIGSSAVAKVDPSTLPAGYGKLVNYLNGDQTAMLEKTIGKELDDTAAPEAVKQYLKEVGYDIKPNYVDNINTARQVLFDELLDDMNMSGSPYTRFLETRNKLQKDNFGKGVGPRSFTISADDDMLYQTAAAKLDREYSDRLGIGRSHTPMNDNALGPDTRGVYMAGGIGIDPYYATGETGVSTAAHERMHAWQDANSGWDSRVTDAIGELRDELKNFYHDKPTIKKYRGSSSDIDYYLDPKEQEARMLQSYLDNEGFTDTHHKHDARGVEWGNEVKPAFDKFYDKLRTLSKAGVALPAVGLALLLGENYNNKKKEG